ncbi:hypothetical protein O6H91_03G092500 [Diphasiastrum complanatum]|uniref:Uncharacterized protein n=1 Tax=Diphasiastrum complanatum TaxID=34168 RepID=A0ACC2E9B9_DIPCM|nr:hypothetical protein O6H91_Y047400 [Diphasiastrum complanatum]KAJ7563002.1 hypothetical protein O6H91_03G092500 [Diphasiastrum complanatum]
MAFQTVAPIATKPRHSLPFSRIDDHLRTLNKPAVKTIHSPDGDIIDCVPIHQQIALDHPKLRNHKLQMHPQTQPSYGTAESVNRFTKMGRSNEIRQLWHENGRCPSATVAVRRITAEDIRRVGSVERFGRKFHQPPKPKPRSPKPKPRSRIVSRPGHEYATAYLDNNEYYGTRATINVWNPHVQGPLEFSVAQIWLAAGSFDNGDLNTIEVGWMVHPKYYGDNNTRLFTFWTDDAYQFTGCYNHDCLGFVQVSSEVALGASISPVSSDGGVQYEIQLMIWKDSVTRNWWLKFGNDAPMGYWPAEIFSHLSTAATSIQWGGEISNFEISGQHTQTQMGSGNFAQAGSSHASYFKNIFYVNAANQLVFPTNLQTSVAFPNCYSIQVPNANSFYFGGPGRNSNCP